MIQYPKAHKSLMVLNNAVKSLAYLVKIVPTSGSTLYFTTYCDSINYFDGNTYEPSAIVEGSAYQQTGDLDNNQDLSGVIASSGSLLEEDLQAGKYIDAVVTISLIDWRRPWAGPILERTFDMGEMSFGKGVWTGILEGLARRLQDEFGEVHTWQCPHRLGDKYGTSDPGCHYNLAANTDSGSVTGGITDNKSFQSDLTEVDDFYNVGELLWTSGNNAGIRSEVKDYVQTNGVVTLQIATPYDIQVGDDFDVGPGCWKIPSRCVDLGQEDNFGGTPYIPGVLKSLKAPTDE